MRRHTWASIGVVVWLALGTRASPPNRMTAEEALFGYQNYPEEFSFAADVIELADPVADAKAAVVRGDMRLIQVCDGYGGCVESATVTQASEAGAFRTVISTTGCVIRSREEQRFRVAARLYASRYNSSVRTGGGSRGGS